MKKLLFFLTVLGLLVLGLGGTAGATPPTPADLATAVAGAAASPGGSARAAATDRTSPSVSAVSPASWANDIDTSVTISGSGFVATPTVSLGSTALTSVTWVNGTTLTVTVPWGLNPGGYPLTVVNPDGGSVTLANAYTVTPGIGQWNGGNLFGGDVRQILIKPGAGNSNTLYAPAYGLVGLFRSTDAGQSWKFTGAGLSLGNYQLAVDPQHPDWLYAFTGAGVMRSTDEGDSWNAVTSEKWPDGRPMGHGRVYPSPYDPQLLFVSSYIEPLDEGSPGDAQGLIRSTNGGTAWTIVPSLNGVSVVDVAFDPSDHAQMALVTKDARVYHSGDGGANWSQVANLQSQGLSSLGFNEQLAYNPYKPGEVWIVSDGTPGKVFKSSDASLSNWQDKTPAYIGGASITFTGPDSVYIPWFHSTDGGTNWPPAGIPVTGVGALLFDPTNPQIGYVGDRTYGVQKTTDGGLTWQIANQGLAGMTCSSLAVSPGDPLRVFATFGASPGVYRSLDGAGTWGFVQVPGMYPIVAGVCTDPTDPDRVYAISNDVYRSMDEGASWTDLGFVTSAPPPVRGFWCIAPDPFQSGHLLAALNTGSTTTAGYLYASSDYGASWQAVSMPGLSMITDIAFDPKTPGLVYMTTGAFGFGTNGTGVHRSTDGGATWTRIDDLKQPDMNSAYTISVATQPQRMLFVSTQRGDYRSTDGGATWRKTQGGPGTYLFANGDSTRLYAGAPDGLSFSSDGGDTWTKAAGAFGQLQITALACAVSNGQTIIYAATNGGQAGTSNGTAARMRGASRAATNRHVDAGIYRYVVVRPKLAFKLSGLKKGALKLGKHLTASGVVTPGALAGNKVRLVLQKKVGKWRTVKTVMVTIKRGGTCSWTFKATKKGSFRLQVSMAKAAVHAAATTKWLGFKVK